MTHNMLLTGTGQVTTFSNGKSFPTKFLQDQLPDVETLLIWLGRSYAELARSSDALAIADRVRASRNPYALAWVCTVYVAAGDRARAETLLREIEQPENDPGPYALALARDALGDTEGALPLLERVVSTHNLDALYLKVERFSPTTRSHPRFQALLRTVAFPA